MARIPGLIWRPLPENATQPGIRPTQWIVHTAVDGPGPTDLGDYFERKDITLESHTWLSWTQHEQLMDTEVRADANYKASVRAISTETEDDGTPVERPWIRYQLTELIRTGVALNRLHGIPPVLPPTWDAPGMGYHSLYPGIWTPYRGKTCPGATRIHQFKTIVLPGIQAALHDEVDVTKEELKQAIREVLNEGTGAGQTSWAGTSAETLAVAQRNANSLAKLVGRAAAAPVDPGSVAAEFAKRLAA